VLHGQLGGVARAFREHDVADSRTARQRNPRAFGEPLPSA
jgi:hypothetical protein